MIIITESGSSYEVTCHDGKYFVLRKSPHMMMYNSGLTREFEKTPCELTKPPMLKLDILQFFI